MTVREFVFSDLALGGIFAVLFDTPWAGFAVLSMAANAYALYLIWKGSQAQERLRRELLQLRARRFKPLITGSKPLEEALAAHHHRLWAHVCGVLLKPLVDEQLSEKARLHVEARLRESETPFDELPADERLADHELARQTVQIMLHTVGGDDG